MSSPRRHHVTDAEFAMLAAGGGGSETARRLALGQYSRHTLLIYGLTELTEAAGYPRAERTREAYDLLAEIQRKDAAAVDSVLIHPAVGAWARRCLNALTEHRDVGEARPELLAGVATAAAIRARAECSVEIPVIGGLAMLPSLGAVRVAGDRCRVIVGADVRIRYDGGSVILPADPRAELAGWLPIRRLQADSNGQYAEFLLDDVDPFRLPDAGNLAGRLTGAEAGRLETALSAAWGTLIKNHWTVAEEVEMMISVLTPLRPGPYGHVSVSSRETFGAVALSPTDDELTLAVTLAHELQHAKLGALLDLVTLTEPDDGRRYYAPWREDPRPIAGLLQGTYAHLGVAGFWRRQRHAVRPEHALRAHASFVRWREAALDGATTLIKSRSLTVSGQTFAAGMTETLRAWLEEPVPADALAFARNEADVHRDRWRHRHGPIP